VPEYTRPIPLDEALAAIDSPSAVAGRKVRAQKWAKELEGDARGSMFQRAGQNEIHGIYEPFRTYNRLYGTELDAAEREAGRRADAIVLRECEIVLRAQDVAQIYADPDRAEAERVWQKYARGVGAIAWAQGNKEADFIRRWSDLIAARRDAESFDDAAAVRSIDARLLRLVGIPHPVLPEAAWDAADELGLAERQDEYDRLEKKYPGTRPGTGTSSTNGIAKVRTRRETRPPHSSPSGRAPDA